MIKRSLPFTPVGLVVHVEPNPDRLIIVPGRIPPPPPVQHAAKPPRRRTGTTLTPSPTCSGMGCLSASRSGLGPDPGAFQLAAALTTAFVKRLPNVVMPWTRRTHRLGGLQAHLGFALHGGRKALQSKRSVIPTSGDMLLRLPARIARPIALPRCRPTNRSGGSHPGGLAGPSSRRRDPGASPTGRVAAHRHAIYAVQVTDCFQLPCRGLEPSHRMSLGCGVQPVR